MKTLYCRIYQFILKIANYFIPYKTPQYVSGADSLKGIGGQVAKEQINKVLIVTGGFISTIPSFETLTKSLSASNIAYLVFNEIQSNPTDTIVEKGFAIFKENGCKGIVAIGGGSCIDCGKAIAARVAKPNKSIAQLQGILKILKKTVALWAIPTTAGTGSETTIAAVITEEKTHHKASINDPNLMPKYAILDPVLTLNLPKGMTSTTAMDALTHAVEAYTNHTYNTALENSLAKDAVKLIYENVLTAYHHPDNMDARYNLLMASFYGGRAFTRGCVGYVHAIGHTISGLYNKPHGLVMAVILPIVLRQYGTSAQKRLAELADYCGMQGSEQEKAEQLINWIEKANEEMGIPKGFDYIKDEDIDQMIDWADKESNPLYPVPQIWNRETFRQVIKNCRISKPE